MNDGPRRLRIHDLYFDATRRHRWRHATRNSSPAIDKNVRVSAASRGHTVAVLPGGIRALSGSIDKTRSVWDFEA